MPHDCAGPPCASCSTEDPAAPSGCRCRPASSLLDFSKNLLDDAAVDALLAVARDRGLPERIEAMFAGEHINSTEDRAVLHTALRRPADAPLVVDGQDVTARGAGGPRPHGGLRRAASGPASARARPGERFTTVVNIGIGGSDLGPRMVVRALRRSLDGDARRCASSPTSTAPTSRPR